MQPSVRRAALCALTAALFLLPGCGKAQAVLSGASSASAETASADDPAATAPTADPCYTGSRENNGVRINWNALQPPGQSVPQAENRCSFSPHYSRKFTPRDDYGTLHTYTGAVGTSDGIYPVYGLLDAQLRLLTPAVYDSIGGNDYLLFLIGNTWRPEDDPRAKKLYSYDRQLEYLYQHMQIIARDGSWILDNNYCYYERIKDGYMLFSIDGSLTLISEKGVVTARLSGGDYCWVQPIEKGRLFAFHGLDGSVTVRDRTGRAVSYFTKAQIGDDVRYTCPGGMPPAVELIWQGGIGYVQHYNDGQARFWMTRYLYADTGEVKDPPVRGLIQDGYVEQERVEEPYVSEKVSVPDADVPKAVKSRASYFAVRDRDTEEIYYYATDSDYGDGEEYAEAVEWTLYDSTGRIVIPVVKGDRGTLDGGYLKFVRYEQTGALRADDGDAAYITQYIRLTDGGDAFYYRAAPAESGM